MRKICLVTGGTSGVGRAVAAGLVRTGAEVVILARDAARGEASAAALRRDVEGARVSVLGGDLADPVSLRKAAVAFRGSFDRLDVLVAAAGIITWRRSESAGGHELVFATNHLGHVLLATELGNLMAHSAPARYLAVGGGPGTVSRASLDLDDLAERRSTYGPIRVAVQTMLARVLWTLELARRWQARGVTANVFFPGLVRSGLGRDLPLPLRLGAGLVQALLPARCPTGVWAATAPELESVTGRYIMGRRAVPFPDTRPETTARLWEISEALTAP
jgi:NAD(P)-dependent dehydrogenase (short-subunit alcohol dehydrogenase family)